MKSLRNYVQAGVISSGLRWSPLRWFYRLFYRIGIRALEGCTRGLAVKSLYLRQGLLEDTWVPGSSDIDTLWVFAKDPLPASTLLHRLSRFKRMFPFLGEPQIVRENELAIYLQHGDAKRRTANRWRLLAGKNGSLPADQAPAWKWKWDCWVQATEAAERLLQVFFQNERNSGLALKLSARKHLLDILRWIDWADSPDRQWIGREETADRLRTSPQHWMDLDWVPPLNAAQRFAVERIPAMLGHALKVLDEKAAECIAGISSNEEWAQAWESRPQTDAWESQALEKRYQEMRSRLGPSLENIYEDSIAKTYIVLPRPLGSDEWRTFLGEMKRIRLSDPALSNPVSILSRTAFMMRSWTVVEGTPFFAFGFPSDAPADRAHAWRFKSEKESPVMGSARGNPGFKRPPAQVLETFAREAAANWFLNWRTLPSVTDQSPTPYSVRRLLAPLLSLRLFFETGRAGDPNDLEGLFDETRKAFPNENRWIQTWRNATNQVSPETFADWAAHRIGDLESSARILEQVLSLRQ